MDNMEKASIPVTTRQVSIDIGTRVFLDIPDIGFSVVSSFVGMVESEYLIISLPTRFDKVKVRLYNGNRIKAKYLYDGSVYAFHTRILETITTPVKVLILSFPKKVQQQELRGMKRNNVVIPGKVEINSALVNVVIFDINQGGCCFKVADLERFAPKKETIRLACKFPGVPQEIFIRAQIRNIRRENNFISVGAEFREPDPAFQEALMDFLVSIQDFS